MQIQLGFDILVRLEGGLVLQPDSEGVVWVYEAVEPLDRGTDDDRCLADAIRQLVSAAKLVERCRAPSAAVMLGERGMPVRADHGMLYID